MKKDWQAFYDHARDELAPLELKAEWELIDRDCPETGKALQLTPPSYDALVAAWKRAGADDPRGAALDSFQKINDCLNDDSDPFEELGLPGHPVVVYYDVEVLK